MTTNEKYYEDKFNEIPKDILNGCSEFVKYGFSQEAKDEIRSMIEKDGLIEWAATHHHIWGMWVRNLFREKGYKDDTLPDGNWDDYYIQVIEHALGYR